MDSIIEMIASLETTINDFMAQYMDTIQTIIDNLKVILGGDETTV